MQLYSLRRVGDGGFGDTQALEDLARVAGERGAEALAISPLHAMFGSDTQRYSPYSPSSRLFLNSPVRRSRCNFLASGRCARRLTPPGSPPNCSSFEERPLIDWPVAAHAKHRILQSLYEGFVHGEHPLHEDFSSFRHASGEALENHCRFEALQEARATLGESLDWREWPEQWRDSRSVALAEFAEENATRIGFFAFRQWLITRCLERAQAAARSAGMSIGLTARPPRCRRRQSGLSRQDELLASLTVGALPDILNRTGQGWGISAFSPEGLVRNGFRAFIEMLRATLPTPAACGSTTSWPVTAVGDSNGAPPRDAASSLYPVDDLLRLLTLESIVIKSLCWAKTPGTGCLMVCGKSSSHARSSACACCCLNRTTPTSSPSSTGRQRAGDHQHRDLPTLNGWWHGRDIDWNARLGLIDASSEIEWRQHREREREGLRRVLSEDPQNFREESHETDQVLDASVRFLGHTRAPLVLLPPEDALGTNSRPTCPAPSTPTPTGQARLPGEMEEAPAR